MFKQMPIRRIPPMPPPSPKQALMRKLGPVVEYNGKLIMESRTGKFVVHHDRDYHAFDSLGAAQVFIDGLKHK